MFGILDCTVNLEFQIFINYKEVFLLNSGQAQLSVIVVLHLENGKDYFISITGKFVPTCFGLPLGLLLSLHAEPVGNLTHEQIQERVSRILIYKL